MTNKVFQLRIALLVAKIKANELRESDDGGTSNFDTPVIILPHWSKNAINQAFQSTGMTPHKEGNAIHILHACEGQGFRRTAMAEAFRDSLKASGYNAIVHYEID